MRTSPVVALLVLGGTSACQTPDLAPLRAELASSAALVCAPPAVRPPHAAKTRDVQPAEVEAAITTLCTEAGAHAEASAAPLAVVHEALAQDRAVAGNLRRSRMMIEAARIDFGAVKADGKGVRTAEEALAQASTASRCGPSWPGLDKFMLASAVVQAKNGHAAEALDLCADVVALARDEDLTGGLTDLLIENSNLQRAVVTCSPFVDVAPKEAATKLAAALTVLRATFPSSLDDVFRRDRAEMVLYTFGKGRDGAQPFACERANALAAASDRKPLTRGDRFDLERSWKASQRQEVTPDAKYLEAYTLSLRVLDTLIERARSR